MGHQLNVALIGNPNTGKTSVFNQLTGLNQKVGNYPGITVEKKEGTCKLPDGSKAHIVDLPGTYSLNSSSPDEKVATDVLLNNNREVYPDLVVVVADIENLKRNLLLYTQIKDLNIPCIFVINMADMMVRRGIRIEVEKMQDELHTKIALVSARKGTGIEELKLLIQKYADLSLQSCLDFTSIDPGFYAKILKESKEENKYKKWLGLVRHVAETDDGGSTELPEGTTVAVIKHMQQKEVILRYHFINRLLKETYHKDISKARDWRSILDRLLTHRVFGFIIFFLILLLVFQSIYNWSSYPMDLIDQMFTNMAQWVNQSFAEGPLTRLVSEGIIPGISGVVIFVPQIAFLFLFISLLEESGYMSRVVFLMDRIMRRFGLNGKSVVPLISGTACAIPAIMATRSIDDWKERLITILITPFITCSARLPVYLIIIALVIPERSFLGFNMQGLTLMGLYMLGFLMAILSASILNQVLKVKGRSFFIAEMPAYKLPLVKNVAITVWEKTKSFVMVAGKIILALSIVLWFLASYGPGEKFKRAEDIVRSEKANDDITEAALNTAIASYKLKHSYIGYLGHAIEPMIKPLGYDWKIGIALVSSFAAREVFVGTLATVYSVGSEQEATIKQRMTEEIDPDTGKRVFNFATGISLLLFYAFAMQCISTLAVVKKETNSWKWPVIQLIFMTGFAYVVSMLAYQALR